MRIRKDGENTRQKILQAACVVFGEKGYRGATHEEICRLAHVNTAAINYHFGSKEALYAATWDYLATQMDELYPIDGGVPLNAPADVRLEGNVRSLLLRKADRGELSNFHRIRMREIMNPTGILDHAIASWMQKMRTYTRSVIQELLGPKATNEYVELCEMSLISQCFMAQGPPWKKRKHALWKFDEKDTERLTQHIVQFSLAGIAEIRRRLESETTGTRLQEPLTGDPHDAH
ncbi:MAG TPA: CerR family C-terminal domain-containing protein [Candidatus Hydrogenedentes bacterium]|nr:CerR family C-terminal domain-containing protein [Candidatus Hydrogenedentota bacterium]HOL75638.1 CerR family C-terminal domain-containing protein [Candidatus Hydrogenedentota bacterium]HPO84369.1 CerR family C-terminal domain-containing protein [Candidatus Hydrogenedentota bacterium]